MSIKVVKIREFIGHTQAVYSFCIHKASGSLYSGGGDAMLVKWTLDKEDGLLLARLPSAVFSLEAHENHIFAGTQAGEFFVFDTDGKNVFQTKISDSPIFNIKRYDDLIFILSGNGQLTILNKEFKKLHAIKLSTKSLRDLVKINDTYLISGTEGKLFILNTKFETIHISEDEQDTVFALLSIDETQTVISGGKDARLRIYNELKLVSTIPAHLLHIHCLDLHPSDKFFLSGSMDKTIKLWDTKSAKLLKVIDAPKYQAHRSSVNKILWFDKNNFISCSDDRTLMCFEIQL